MGSGTFWKSWLAHLIVIQQNVMMQSEHTIDINYIILNHTGTTNTLCMSERGHAAIAVTCGLPIPKWWVCCNVYLLARKTCIRSKCISSFRGKLGRYPPWPGKVRSANMPIAGLRQNRFKQLHSKCNATVGLLIVIYISGSKPSQGLEKAQGQKMPLCEILWNWRPVSMHYERYLFCDWLSLRFLLHQMCKSRVCVYLSSAWIKVEQLKPYHAHKEEMIKINKGKRFQQAVDAVEDFLKKAKGKEQVRASITHNPAFEMYLALLDGLCFSLFQKMEMRRWACRNSLSGISKCSTYADYIICPAPPPTISFIFMSNFLQNTKHVINT